MQSKTYIVKDMEQAYNAARKELGSDAVMMSSRKVRQRGILGIFRKRVLSVTFMYDENSTPKASVKDTLSLSQFANWTKSVKDPATEEINEKLEERVDQLGEAVAKLTEFMEKFDIVKKDITYDYPEDINILLKRMIDAQVREELAHSLAKQTEKLMRERPGVKASEILEYLMIEQFGKPMPILHKKFTQKVILVIGPTGVGKTTTIMKLVADFVKKERKNVGILCTDTYRVGAEEQMSTYMGILDMPYKMIYYPEELTKAMEEMADRDIIFVDTAGKRPGDEQHKEDLLQFIRILKPEDILLCLSATTSFASVKEMIDIYGFIDDYRLMITKLDETKYRGTLLNISWYTKKPLAYVTTGQKVPDDIEVADIEKIVGEIIGEG